MPIVQFSEVSWTSIYPGNMHIQDQFKFKSNKNNALSSTCFLLDSGVSERAVELTFLSIIQLSVCPSFHASINPSISQTLNTYCVLTSGRCFSSISLIFATREYCPLKIGSSEWGVRWAQLEEGVVASGRRSPPLSLRGWQATHSQETDMKGVMKAPCAWSYSGCLCTYMGARAAFCRFYSSSH